MKPHFLPSSRMGKWSAGLILGALAIFLLLVLFGELLNVLPEGLISVTVVLAIAAAIMAAISGLSALVRYKDRAVLVYAAVILGLAVSVIVLTSVWADIN